MAQTKKKVEALLQGLPFFKGLPDSDFSTFLKAANIKDYDKNASLFLQGDLADRFFIVIDGWIKLYRNTAEGDEVVLALMTRGDVFGEAAIFSKAHYPFSADATEKAKIFEIPASILKDRAKNNTDITARVMNTMSHEIDHLQLEKEHMALMNASQRVGCLLLQLSSHMTGTGGTFCFPYDKSLAATRLGMKPETFSRALSQLKSKGVSVKGAEIRIENFLKLSAYCCVHCSAGPDECRCAKWKNFNEKTCTAQTA